MKCSERFFEDFEGKPRKRSSRYDEIEHLGEWLTKEEAERED
jgi:hypothetical protein